MVFIFSVDGKLLQTDIYLLRPDSATWHIDKYFLTAGSCLVARLRTFPYKGHDPAIREYFSMCCKINSGRKYAIVFKNSVPKGLNNEGCQSSDHTLCDIDNALLSS